MLRRFKWLVAGGLTLAIALATLSLAKYEHGSLVYRKHAIWQSTSTILLTQGGFPWGRATLPTGGVGSESQFANPTWLSSLTDLYAQFANSDQVRALMQADGAPSSATFTATPIQPVVSTGTLPVISLVARAYTPADAIKATVVGRKAFLQYISEKQTQAAIPDAQRVDIQTLQQATLPTLFQGRKKTLPIVIFLAVVSATIALAFVLENLRPEVSPVAIVTPDASAVGEQSLSRSRA